MTSRFFQSLWAGGAKCILSLLVATALLGSGCLTSRSAMPGVLRSDIPSKDVTVVDTVDVSHTHLFLLWGLAPDAPEELFRSDLVRAVSAANADGVANVRINSHYTVGDTVLNLISLGFLVPRTYRIRADIVRLRGPEKRGAPVKASDL